MPSSITICNTIPKYSTKILPLCRSEPNFVYMEPRRIHSCRTLDSRGLKVWMCWTSRAFKINSRQRYCNFTATLNAFHERVFLVSKIRVWLFHVCSLSGGEENTISFMNDPLSPKKKQFFETIIFYTMQTTKFFSCWSKII